MTISDMINNSARSIALASTLAALVSSACALRNDRPEWDPLSNNGLKLYPKGHTVSYVLTDMRVLDGSVDIFLNGILTQRIEDILEDAPYPLAFGGSIEDLKPGHYTLKIVYSIRKSDDKQQNPLVETGTFEIR